MAKCGQRFGTKFWSFLTFCMIPSTIHIGHCYYVDESQHGGFENWIVGEEPEFEILDGTESETLAALGYQLFDIANSDEAHVSGVKDDMLLKEWQRNDDDVGQFLQHQQQDDNINIARRSTTEHVSLQNRDIPITYLLSITLTDDQVENILEQLSLVLDLPRKNIFIYRTLLGQWTTISLYFVKPGVDPIIAKTTDLIPAEDVERNLNLNINQIDHLVQDISMHSQYQMMLSARTVADAFYTAPYFPYVAACAGLILITLVISLTWYCAFRGHSKSTEYNISGLSSQSSHIPQQICTLFPSGKPDVHNPTAIQPNLSHFVSQRSIMGGSLGSPLHLHGSLSPAMPGSLSPRSIMSGTPCSSPSSGTPLTGSSTPIHTPPMRIRGKLGLLERRGSNASLTIDLGPPSVSSQDTTSSWGSPPRESSAEEFLLSAGNRMSRKQLRNCLKNVRAVHEEFWEIPMNHPDRIEVAGSGMKNRYRTIIPNEETRVKLCDIEDDGISSYINANYIRGYGGEPRAYIATQGPMSNTVSDFWHMVWQEKAPIIVMITKLREKNRTKCESYIPETFCQYGDIEVKTNSISERNGYILRLLTLKCGDKEHSVQHYWYTAWPDHKAPNTAKTLLDLVKLVDQQRYDSCTGKMKGPVIVHCSAGIGRTGCFIAASIGIQQLRGEHMVDVLGIICGMRLDRGGMIQTNEQYEFLHQTLCLFERELPERPPSGES